MPPFAFIYKAGVTTFTSRPTAEFQARAIR